jgi:hypothetical protein
LVVAEGKVYYSRDDGLSWQAAWAAETDQQPAACVLAPAGLRPGQPAWLGLANGDVLPVNLP